jgi:hypothetical protein
VQILNPSPFVFFPLAGADPDGADVFTLLVKGTFRFSRSRGLVLADEPRDVELADRWLAEPGASPLLYESDLALTKPGCDVVAVGSAVRADGKPAKEAEVELAFGDAKKRVQVRGERAAARLPLSNLEAFPPKGLFGKSRDPDGIGFLPRTREPRRGWAGTYDDAWKESRAPFLPADFDVRYFQCAYPELVVPEHPRGGETLRVRGLLAGGPVDVRLPRWKVEVVMHWEGGGRGSHRLALDTIVVDSDAAELLLSWRFMAPCPCPFPDVLGFEVLAQDRGAA